MDLAGKGLIVAESGKDKRKKKQTMKMTPLLSGANSGWVSSSMTGVTKNGENKRMSKFIFNERGSRKPQNH